MNLIVHRRVRLAAVVAIVTACGSSTEPTAFNLCVHALGAPFTPGASASQCVAPPMVSQGQTITVVLEADNVAGGSRQAQLSIVGTTPTGWGVTLGGPTIDVPGQQTLTLSVPDPTLAGFYGFIIQAHVGTKLESELRFDIRVAAPF